jgi:secretion/DNA translocation related CpaE-like protein
VLLVTADPALAGRLARIVADAGGSGRAVVSPHAAGPAWGRAALVLLGADAAPRIPDAGAAPPGGLVLVADRDGDIPVDLPPAGHLPAGDLVPGDPPGGAAGAALEQEARRLGATGVAVLPDGQAWLARIVEEAVLPPPRAQLVGVVGGRGGAGASTLAVALAVTAAGAGAGVVLVDLDPLGGGLDLLLGAERCPGVRWPDVVGLPGRLPHGTLSAALPVASGVAHLTWDRDHPVPVGEGAALAVLDAAAREADLVVVDLPRSAARALTGVLAILARVLLIVPAEVRAAASARGMVDVLGPHTADLRLVVRGPAPTGLTAEAVADSLDLPLAGELRAEPGLAAALDRGDVPGARPRGPLAVLSRRVVDEVLAG